MKNEGGQTELSVINPTATFGPTLGGDISASLIPILTLLTAGAAQMANISFPVADVRDIADIHARAMTHPGAADERFIACCDGSPITMDDAARILSEWTGVESTFGSPIVVKYLNPPPERRRLSWDLLRDRSTKRYCPRREAWSAQGWYQHPRGRPPAGAGA
jgi:nucleoside-diphosphate-sugar epimerase